MALHIDFPEDSGFETIPPGTYTCSVFDASVLESKSSGAPYIAWTLIILEGDYSGRKLFYNTSLQPQALWKLREVLQALGMEVGDSIELELDELLGTHLVAETGLREWNGKEREEVQNVLPISRAVKPAKTAAPKSDPKKQPVKRKNTKKSF